jgi:hypothetical protein
MVTNNAIALTAAGIVGYDGAGNFTATAAVQSNVLIGGGGAQTLVNVAPPGNIGTPLISNGAVGTAPVFGTAQVRGGGTGLATLTANQLMASGTTATGNMQQIGSGTAGQVLASNGSPLPSFQTLPVISSWVVQGVSTTAAASTGYFVSASVTITLPTGLTTGATISIYNYFGISVVINAGTGQTINIGVSTSSSGGTATSATDGDTVTLVFRSDALSWNAVSSIGTWVLA